MSVHANSVRPFTAIDDVIAVATNLASMPLDQIITAGGHDDVITINSRNLVIKGRTDDGFRRCRPADVFADADIYRQQFIDLAVMFGEDEHFAVFVLPKAQIDPFAADLGNNDVFERLLNAFEIKLKLFDLSLLTQDEIIFRDIEHAPANDVPKEVFAEQIWRIIVPVNIAADAGKNTDAVDLARFIPVKLRNRIDEIVARIVERQCIAGIVHRMGSTVRGLRECALTQGPPIIGTGHANIDLINLLLADIIEDHPALPARIEDEVLMMAETCRPNIGQRASLIQERVILGDAIGVPIALFQWIKT